MPYNSYTVAEFIIEYCNDKKYNITNMRLNKLLYFVQAEFLVRKNDVCFSDDILAWTYGPVVRKVYTRYAIYGNTSLPKYDLYHSNCASTIISKNDQGIIIDIIEECMRFSTMELVKFTLKQDPWLQAKNLPSKIIRPDTMREFFLK